MARNKFTSEQARAAGRKSKKSPSLDRLKDVVDLKGADLRKMISLHMKKSTKELEELALDKSLPAIESVIIKTVLQAFEKGDFSKLEDMLARSMGKVPNQNINENIDKTERNKALDEIPKADLIAIMDKRKTVNF